MTARIYIWPIIPRPRPVDQSKPRRMELFFYRILRERDGLSHEEAKLEASKLASMSLPQGHAS